MYKNYLIIAWRNLKRNKIYSFINITGLAIGLAAAMLIILYIKDESSFDKFHHHVNRIYRISQEMTINNETRKNGNSGSLQGPRFTQNVPGIESFVRFQSGSEDFKFGNDIIAQDVKYTDSSFFSVFTFPLLYGDPKTCLKNPHSIVLSAREAKRRFGTTNAVGNVIMVRVDSAFQPYTVTAVAENCPQNSSIYFNTLLPISVSENDATNDENWFNYYLNTFLFLSPNAKVASVEKQMNRFYKKDAGLIWSQMVRKYDIKDADMGTYQLQPFTDMHLSKDLPPTNGLQNASEPIYSYILSGIAIFILLIACINFVNLTIARSVKRAKEIGIRKVVGSGRKQLIFQFLGESFLLCFIAFGCALVLVQIVLPLFNELANKKMALSYLLDAKLIVGYLMLFFITSMLAGFYPALILSGYSPVATLYNRFKISGKNYLQKSLVVLQFALASFLIAGTFIIYAQFNFLTNTDLGYDDNNIVVVQKEGLSHQRAEMFKRILLQNPDIQSVAPNNDGYWSTIAKVNADSSIQFAYETVDEDFMPMMKIPLVSGRNFAKDRPSDSTNSVIVNEAFVKQAGWKQPLGQTVNFFFHDNEKYQVIGVVKDYHYAPLNEKIGPQLFTMKNDNKFGQFNIKINPGKATSALKYIESSFKEFFPMSPYSYVFKDEENQKNYEKEQKWKQILLFGAVLTIFISCIGLFGLSVLSTEKRTKEIGIRKVLGASVSQIVSILSADFLKLVIIALAISVPAAWIVGSKWLQNYPYRISISFAMFAVAALLVLLIALVTVSFQAFKTAVANPVKSLRTE